MDMIATIGATADSPNSVVAIGNTNRMRLVSVIASPRRAASITSVVTDKLAFLVKWKKLSRLSDGLA